MNHGGALPPLIGSCMGKKTLKRYLEEAESEAENIISGIRNAIDQIDELDFPVGFEKNSAQAMAFNLLAQGFSLPEEVQIFLECIRDNKPMSEHLPSFALLSV